MSQNLKYFDLRTSYDRVGDTKIDSFTIDPNLNNILASVHQRLKYNPKPSVPKIPRAIADTIMSRKVPEVLLMENPSKSRKTRVGKNSIPQLQADREFKNLTQARRFGLTSDMMNYQNQKRYRELLCQKRILEEMLKEHQKLQSDRDNIASEINYMRSYLDNIRTKLDVSLRKLNSHKTFSECNMEKKVVKTQPQIRKTCPRHGHPTRPVVAHVRATGRMAGGFDAGSRSHIKSNISLVIPKREIKAQPKIAAHHKKTPKGPKQWVYATRIDRKENIRSIFS